MLLIGSLVFGTSPALADKAQTEEAPVQDQIVFKIGSPEISVAGQRHSMDSAALILNGRAYLPLRALSDAIGAEIEISEDFKALTITYDGYAVGLRTDSTIYTVDGERRIMSSAPYINAQSRTMVPVRVISEGLGLAVEATYNEQGYTDKVLIFKSE